MLDFCECFIKAADAHASSTFVKWKFFVFLFCRLLSSSSLVFSRAESTIIGRHKVCMIVNISKHCSLVSLGG